MTRTLALVAVAAAVVTPAAARVCMEGEYASYPGTAKTCSDPVFDTFRTVRSIGRTCLTDAFENNNACLGGNSVENQITACNALGLSLCTIDQMSNTELFGAYDFRECGGKVMEERTFWTSTRCDVSSTTRSYLSYRRRPGNDITMKCEADSSILFRAVCCASKRINNDICASCPANAMTVEEDGVKFCKCIDGYTESWLNDGTQVCSLTRSIATGNCPANKYDALSSPLSCASHSLHTMFPDDTSCQVHVPSSEPGQDCPSAARSRKLDWNFATTYCEAKGARLCTTAELDLFPRTVAHPQCESEFGLVWTNERCFSSTNDEHYWAVDFSSSTPSRVCLRKTSTSVKGSLTGVRCCADTVTTKMTCASCPEGSTSSSGSTSFDSCACPADRQLESGRCADPIPTLATCPAGKYNGESAADCKQLTTDWPRRWRPLRRKTCGTILDSTGECFSPATFDEAQATCSAIGARLCTHNEVRNRFLQREGRRCGSPLVRTSTPCCNGFNGAASCDESQGHVLMSTSGNSRSYTCAADTDNAEFACCADESPRPCTNCPRKSTTSGPGSTSIDQCECEAPFYMDNGECHKFSAKSCPANHFLGSRMTWMDAGLKPSRNAGQKVAATSKPNDSSCGNLGAVDFSQAQSICENAGMRLCKSAFELRRGLLWANDKCRRRGNTLAWTSRICEDGRHYVTNGDPTADVCRGDNGNGAVVCCADQRPQTCIECPDDSTAPAGTEFSSDCVCTHGYNPDTSNSNDPQCAVPE